MARIRSIKPEFWTSEQVIDCSPNARLLFIGLWNFCDDAGRHSSNDRRIKAELFPGDDFTTDDIRRMIDELVTNGLLIEYLIENKTYLQVTGWRHQKIDRPQTPKYPAPDDKRSTIIRRSFATEGIRDKGEDKGEEKKESHILAQQHPVPRERSKAEYDRIEAALRCAAGLENDPSPNLFDLSTILGFLDQNVSLDETILPVLRASKAKGRKGNSWKYYAPAINDAIAQRQTNGASVAKFTKPADDPEDPFIDLGCGQEPKRSVIRKQIEAWQENPRLNRWDECRFGAPPDQPGCRVPDKILAEFGLTRVVYPRDDEDAVA
jgi:hypothetical protein